MIQYFIRSGLVLATFYLLYLLVLRRETFHQLNRFYLLSGILLSLIIPIIPSIRLLTSNPEMVNLIDNLSISAAVSTTDIKSPELINPVLIIYLGGLSWFALRFFSGLGKVFYLLHRFPSVRLAGQKTVILEGNCAPFTFFNILFVCRNDYESGPDKSIIHHEIAHIRQMHSIDLVLLELASTVLWFNPFIWLTRMALKAEHEYEADEYVMKEGYNRSAYQQLLFEKTIGVSAVVLANNFNYSLLKNRIKMLYKNKSDANARLKYLLILPVFIVLTTFIKLDLSLASPPDDKIYDQVDVMPEYPGGMEAFRTHFARNLTYPDIAREMGVQGKVFVQFVVDKEGKAGDAKVIRCDINTEIGGEIVVVGYSEGDEKPSGKAEGIEALEKESVRIVYTLANFIPGKQDGEAVNVLFTFPVNFSLQ